MSVLPWSGRKWEYLCIAPEATGIPMAGDTQVPFYKRVEAGLTELGEHGWELCCTLWDNVIVFKRKVKT